jgi:capsular polysaccharide export protein
MNNKTNHQNNKGRAKLALLSCSRSQLSYFSKLSEQLKKDNFAEIILLNHKKIKIHLFACVQAVWGNLLSDAEKTKIKQQVDLYIRRKKYTSAGQKRKQWYWRVVLKTQSYMGFYLFFRYKHIFQRSDYSHLLVWNGKKFYQAIVIIAAKNYHIKCLYMETGPLPGYMQVSQHGVDASSQLPKNTDFYMQYSSGEKSSLIQKPESENLIVFVPFQVVEDSNIYCHSSWITNMRHLYEELEKCANQFSQLFFVIKEHPACSEVYEDLKRRHSKITFAPPQASISELFAKSDFVITVNSTVGLEALLVGKPLITLGDALYNIDEVVQSVSTVEGLYQAINKIFDGWQPNHQILQGFLNYLKNNYAIEGNMDVSTHKQLSNISKSLCDLLE